MECIQSKHQGPAVLSVTAAAFLTGIALGLAFLFLLKPISMAMGRLQYDLIGLTLIAIPTAIFTLLAMIPMAMVFRHKSGVLVALVSGALIGVISSLVYFVGGVIRWGMPPVIFYPLVVLTIGFTVILTIAVERIVARRRDGGSRG